MTQKPSFSTVAVWSTLLCVLLGIPWPDTALAGGGPKGPRPGDPYLSIPLDRLGFDAIPQRLLIGGATMFTLHFVDDTHLLVTFNSRGLIPRINDGLPQEDDRLITAVLVELPTGNILARTTWHTRDHEQYLWPLAHGMFLLRIRSRLTVIAPLRNLGQADAFREQIFLDMNHPIGYVSVSPGGDLLVVETVTPPRTQSESNASAGAPQVVQLQTKPNIEIRFYRMLYQTIGDEPPHLTAQAAGIVSARNFIRVPATSEGFLDILQESNETWLFDFQSHAGKRLQLSPFDTSCAPSPYFVSRTEFVALGCRGSETHLMLSGFNLRGEQPWIQVLSGNQIAPMVVTAPDAGRFAFSRVLVAASYYDIQNLVPEELSGQEIQVIQHYDGRILLKVMASPIQRTGQNFDLSENGLSFAVIRNGNLDVFHLPELSRKDAEQVKLAAALVEKNDARIRLNPIRPTGTAKATPAPQTAESAITINAPTPEPEAPKANAGDAQPSDGPRQAPSLYGPDYPKNPKL